MATIKQRILADSRAFSGWKRLLLSATLAFATLPTPGAPAREIWDRCTIAYLGRDGADPAYGAARQGARDAARALEHKHHLEITLHDLTPSGLDAEAQAEALRQAYLDGIEGVLISVADPALVGPEIDFLARHEIPTVTFHRDAPASERVATVLTNNTALGRMAFEQAADQLGWRGGKLVVLAGDLDAAHIQARLRGVHQADREQGNVDIHAVVGCPETVDGALAVINRVRNEDRNEEIDGWVFLGGWPLMGDAPLPWEPDEQVCVAIDALPPMLVYVANGQADALVAQRYYRWGHEAMTTLIETLVSDQATEDTVIETGGEIITPENLAGYGENWADWMQ